MERTWHHLFIMLGILRSWIFHPFGKWKMLFQVKNTQSQWTSFIQSFLIFHFRCIIIYGLNIIYLLCLEFYVHGSLICWQNGMDLTSSIYYAWNLMFMDLSSFWKMLFQVKNTQNQWTSSISYLLFSDLNLGCLFYRFYLG